MEVATSNRVVQIAFQRPARVWSGCGFPGTMPVSLTVCPPVRLFMDTALASPTSCFLTKGIWFQNRGVRKPQVNSNSVASLKLHGFGILPSQ